jgi:hypothetical protein
MTKAVLFAQSWRADKKINRIRPVRSKCNSDRGHFCFIGPHRKHQFQLQNHYYGKGHERQAKRNDGMNYTNNFAKALAYQPYILNTEWQSYYHKPIRWEAYLNAFLDTNSNPWYRSTDLYSARKTGGINVIDLANINSCSFIATQDLGKKIPTTLSIGMVLIILIFED